MARAQRLRPATAARIISDLDYCPDYLSAAGAARYMTVLRNGLAWQRRSIVLFGHRYLQPRMIAFYGDEGVSYSYSRQRLSALPWPAPLARLRDGLVRHCRAPFNCVLANLYRDGDDCMGWHSDDEAELGEQPLIASLSLGAARDFALRSRRGSPKLLRLSLLSGSLLVMRGDFQQAWQHALPRAPNPCAARINLTFRQVTLRGRGDAQR
ncbi:MAG: alpha-ketoglutarate-dependent dioxygenase AlkB [Steroidobacteraceae bacterium]